MELDEDVINKLKADILAQMRDKVSRKIGTKHNSLPIEHRSENIARTQILIEAEISEEIRNAKYRQKTLQIADELSSEI